MVRAAHAHPYRSHLVNAQSILADYSSQLLPTTYDDINDACVTQPSEQSEPSSPPDLARLRQLERNVVNVLREPPQHRAEHLRAKLADGIDPVEASTHLGGAVQDYRHYDRPTTVAGQKTWERAKQRREVLDQFLTTRFPRHQQEYHTIALTKSSFYEQFVAFAKGVSQLKPLSWGATRNALKAYHIRWEKNPLLCPHCESLASLIPGQAFYKELRSNLMVHQQTANTQRHEYSQQVRSLARFSIVGRARCCSARFHSIANREALGTGLDHRVLLLRPGSENRGAPHLPRSRRLTFGQEHRAIRLRRMGSHS